MNADEMCAMQTKRKFAHELYPHPDEWKVQPLAEAVPYLYARAVGLEVWGTGWFDLRNSKAEYRESGDRTMMLIAARSSALHADALLQGLSGTEAWEWAEERAADESGECARERAVHYGVPIDDIKPYLCGPEPDHHNHYDAPDARGWRTSHRIDGKESECVECCEVPSC